MRTAFGLATAAIFASWARETREPFEEHQIEQFGRELHSSIELLIQSTPDFFPTESGELRWTFGLDHTLADDEDDVVLARAAEAAGIDPKTLHHFFPWNTWTEVAYGLVPRAAVWARSGRRALYSAWLDAVPRAVAEAWQRSSLVPDDEKVEKVQMAKAEQAMMRIWLRRTRYKRGGQEYLAAVDTPTDEGKTLLQSAQVQRNMLFWEDFSVLLTMLAHDYPDVIPFLETASWEPCHA